MADKISLAGDLGSGKSTVAKILIEALGAEYYSTGSIVRSIAERMGMTVGELNKYMETHPEIDREIDDGLKALSYDPRPLIIDSRMAWHFTEGTFRVYLSTDLETSALRIMSANRRGEHAASLDKTVEETRARRQSEEKRYFEQYGVNINDLSNYSLIVDTTSAAPEEVAGVIINAFHAWQRDKSYTGCLICPDRLNYPDDEADGSLIAELSDRLERGEPLPEITVFEEAGEFYTDSGAEAALAYAVNMRTHLSARLVRGSKDGRVYVKMKNNL